MRASLTEVAQRAGVSLSTASRAFGDPGRLAADTRERVLAAAQELGYESARPNTPGRTIGIVVPDVANPVYASLLKSFHEQSWHGRHQIVLLDTNEDLHREREQLVRARALDGYVLCSPRTDAAEIAELAGDTPLVIINQQIAGHPCIVTDATQGLGQAVQHLAALGHTRLAYVRGPSHSWADAQRMRAIEDACAHDGVELWSSTNHAASIYGGQAAAAAVVASGATAVIGYNDLVALGVRAGSARLGRDCPSDLSIVGVDDLDIAAAAHPELTSVRLAIRRSASLAIEILERMMLGAEEGEHVSLGSELIVRGSTSVPGAEPSK